MQLKNRKSFGQKLKNKLAGITNMPSGIIAPVVSGLVIGAAFVILFSVVMLQSPPAGVSISGQTSRHDGVVVFSGMVNATTHQIYAVHSDGTYLTRLTDDNDSLWNFQPVSSPDGSEIAYVAHSSHNTFLPVGQRVAESLYVMDADGTNNVLIAGSPDTFLGRYVWSPNGMKIAYEANQDIFVVDVDGTNNATNLTNNRNATYDFKPTWASNGKIIFESVVFGEDKRSFIESSFKEADINTGEIRKLFDFNYNASGSHVWSPDLNRIAFLQADNITSPASLYIMDANGRSQTRLTETDEFLFTLDHLAWSPDSKKIAFDTIGGLYVIDISDGSAIQLTDGENSGSNPVWSSDGQKIAFTRVISEEEAGIYVMNSADGSGQRQVAKLKPSFVNMPLDWLS